MEGNNRDLKSHTRNEAWGYLTVIPGMGIETGKIGSLSLAWATSEFKASLGYIGETLTVLGKEEEENEELLNVYRVSVLYDKTSWRLVKQQCKYIECY